jgi:tyrosinase
MAPWDRKSYTDAVLCLQKKMAITPTTLIPGVRSRVDLPIKMIPYFANNEQYDDFVATHMNQTPFIHFSGTFLGWHRYFVWHYEQALRNECGYQGYQPVCLRARNQELRTNNP